MNSLSETFDEEKCRTLAKKLARAGIWQVPTLIRLRTMLLSADSAYQQDPALTSLPAGMTAQWQALTTRYKATFSNEQQQRFQTFYHMLERVIAVFTQEGVPMATGSDVGGLWVIPGKSLHQEFQLLSDAGISPLKILQMTTVDAAKLVNRSDIGQVKPHYLANLVLLNHNPLSDVSHLADIAGVYHNGQWLDADALASIKHNAITNNALTHAH